MIATRHAPLVLAALLSAGLLLVSCAIVGTRQPAAGKKCGRAGAGGRAGERLFEQRSGVVEPLFVQRRVSHVIERGRVALGVVEFGLDGERLFEVCPSILPATPLMQEAADLPLGNGREFEPVLAAELLFSLSVSERTSGPK